MNKMMDKVELMLIESKYRIQNFTQNVTESIAKDEEGAEMVEIVIGFAILAAVAFGVVKMFGGAITNKATEASNIIESAKFN